MAGMKRRDPIDQGLKTIPDILRHQFEVALAGAYQRGAQDYDEKKAEWKSLRLAYVETNSDFYTKATLQAFDAINGLPVGQGAHEYLFDVKTFEKVVVRADDVEKARALLGTLYPGMDGEADLEEVDGEEVDIPWA